jgi:hypothetical protein
MSLREWAWIGVAVLCAVGWFARPLSYEAVTSVVLGAVIGAVFSVAISWHFYRQASDELKDVHDRIVRMLVAISGGVSVKASRDKQGNTLLTFIPNEINDELGVADSVQVSTGRTQDGDPERGA